MSHCLNDIDVVVLAGGLGTRLAGVLDGTPKVLAPIGEAPFLSILLAWIQGFGARRVIFGLGHLAGEVESYLKAYAPGDMECISVVELEPLGTAGAIRHLAGHLQNFPVLVLNGDTFVDADLCAFLQSHRNAGAPGSILCTEVADAGRYGSVELKEGMVSDFLEKNLDGAAGLINAGVYLFERDMLDIINNGGASLETDIFQMLEPGTLHGFRGNFTFLDIGTPDDLARAPELLRPYIGAS